MPGRARAELAKLLAPCRSVAAGRAYGVPAAAITPARSVFARLGRTCRPCALALLAATALGCRAGPLAHGGTGARASCTVATTAVSHWAFEHNSESSATARTASLAALS